MSDSSDTPSGVEPFTPPPPPAQASGAGAPVAVQTPCDYTKTKAYAWTDILVKIVSSAALVVLGYVGWQLQSDTENARAATENLDRQHRRYLPMLRSLTELEVELDELEFWLRTAPDGRQFSSDLYHRGTALQYASYALFVPNLASDAGESDPLIDVHYDVTRNDLGANPYIRAPLRASALMLSDLCRLQYSVRTIADAELQLDVSRAAFIVRGQGQESFRVRLARHSTPAWQAWVGTKPFRSAKLLPKTVAVVLAQDVRFGIAQVSHATIASYPTLGDRYVQIRDDVLSSRSVSALNRAAVSKH